MFSSIYSPPPSTPLVEALDHNGRPLCLLSASEVLDQRLKHRSVAILATARPDAILLAEAPGPVFDVTAHAPLQAGLAVAEFAEILLCARLQRTAQISEIMQLQLAVEILYVFNARFPLPLLKALAPPGFLLTDMREIPDLAKRDLIAPLVLEILPSIAKT